MKRVPLDRDEFHLTKNRNSARGGQVLTDEDPAFAGFSFSAVNFAINSIYSTSTYKFRLTIT